MVYGHRTMPSYRFYCLDGRGSIRLADWIDAESDEEAIAKARKIETGAQKCELWQKNRLVASLNGHDLPD
jgi:hypothetical protein